MLDRPCLTALALLLVITASPLARAEAPQPRHAVLADLGLHVIGVGYQQSFSPRFSAQVSANYYVPWTEDPNAFGKSGASVDGDLKGAALRGRMFYYPFAAAPSGLWLSPFAQYGLVEGNRAGERRLGSVWAVGASAGYAFLFWKRALLSVGVGAQYNAARFLGGAGSPGFGRFFPTVDANVGYAF